MSQDLAALVHAALDDCGVRGDANTSLELRLEYLRGAVLGFRLWGWGAAAGTAVHAAGTSAPAPATAREFINHPGSLTAQDADLQARFAEPAPEPFVSLTAVEGLDAALAAIVEPGDPDAAVTAALGDPNAPPVDWEWSEQDAAEAFELENGHHFSWAGARRAFFASLTDSGIQDPYEVVARYCLAKGSKRPSQMTPEDRGAFLASLAKPGPKERYVEWAAIHGPGILREVLLAKEAAKAAKLRRSVGAA